MDNQGAQDRGYPVFDRILGAHRAGQFALAGFVQPVIAVDQYDGWPTFTVGQNINGVAAQTTRVVLRIPDGTVIGALRLEFDEASIGQFYGVRRTASTPFAANTVPAFWGGSAPASLVQCMALSSAAAIELDHAAPGTDQRYFVNSSLGMQIIGVPDLSGPCDFILEASAVNQTLFVNLKWQEKSTRT